MSIYLAALSVIQLEMSFSGLMGEPAKTIYAMEEYLLPKELVVIPS